jgi:hypothetical protein
MKILLAPDPPAGNGTAAVAAPPAPAKAPTPAPAAPAKPSAPPSRSDDPFSSIDARAAKPKEKPAAPAVAPKPGEPPAKAPEAPPAPADLKDPRRLRSAFDLKSAEVERSRVALTELQSKLEAAEARGKDTTALTERIGTMEKEREALQSQLRAFKQEASPEFQAKYEKPFKDAADFAKQISESLEITEYNDAGDPVKTRQGTYDDFIQLYAMPINKASKLARKMYGEDAQTIINHLNELQRLDFNKKRGLEDERKNALANEEKEKAEAATRKETIAKLWRDTNQDIIDNHPDWQPAPDDKEGAEILKESYATVDKGIHDRTLTLEQKIRYDANQRHRAALQPWFAHRLKQANETISELQTTIAEMKGSGPGKTQHPNGEPPPDAGEKKPWKQELRETVPVTGGD